ncbi:MAG: hypothetical protein LBP22_01170 [Deltaproteobacteria bacterium]|jgi:hypothetical protein|nr:hypothetical protein [Deltaproteobacteria bacterium]
MRALTQEEILKVVKKNIWATIITVRSDGVPYAIEATPFETETETCFMINPNGTTARNLKTSDHVLLKYTMASGDLEEWIGISCLGTGRFVHEKDEIVEGWRLLGLVLGLDFSSAADRFAKTPERSPMLAVKVHQRTGRCSFRPGEAVPEKYV